MLKVNYFQQSIGFFKGKNYICKIKLKAYHNKDYSVVKTFKAGSNSRFLFKKLSNRIFLFLRLTAGVIFNTQ
jgi:hypothetical protein